MVVVTPSCERGFYMDYKDGSQKWETFLITEFLEHLRQEYRVGENRQNTLLFGVSMGGLGALRLSFKYPDKFAGVAALEPSVDPALRWADVQARNRFYRSDELMHSIFGKPVDGAFWEANNPASIALADPQRLQAALLGIYLDVGDEDCLNIHEGTEFVHRLLWDNQIPHEYHVVRGADHVGRTLGPRIDEGLEFLGRVVNPPPADPKAEAFRRSLAPLRKRWGVTP
jgi:S-formylglutathione hydrolase